MKFLEFAYRCLFKERQTQRSDCLAPPYSDVIFLDFDGVLHPRQVGDFCLGAAFAQAIELYPTISIVVTSNWRLHGLSIVKSCMPHTVQSRVVATTSHLTGEFAREVEIQAFINEHSVQRYLIIDDNAALFSKTCKHLFLTEYTRGLDQTAIEHFAVALSTTFASENSPVKSNAGE